VSPVGQRGLRSVLGLIGPKGLKKGGQGGESKKSGRGVTGTSWGLSILVLTLVRGEKKREVIKGSMSCLFKRGDGEREGTVKKVPDQVECMLVREKTRNAWQGGGGRRDGQEFATSPQLQGGVEEGRREEIRKGVAVHILSA